MSYGKSDCLLVVDLQPDFMPGGPLAVAGGDDIVEPILKLMDRFGTVVATQDWHPKGHSSFASTWPVHCVQGTYGARLPDPLADRADLILRKGANPEVDSYSAFHENKDHRGVRVSTGLMGLLLERVVRRVFVCGLARDYCVLWSALDASPTLPTHFLWDLTRAVDPSKDAEIEHQLRRASIQIERAPS